MALVLSRKKGEKIVIPSQMIELEILDIQGSRVRLGITAPDDIVILREEVIGRDPPAVKTSA